jgi:hypothetical protein
VKKRKAKPKTVKQLADPTLLERALAQMSEPQRTPVEQADYEARMQRLQAALERLRHRPKK